MLFAGPARTYAILQVRLCSKIAGESWTLHAVVPTLITGWASLTIRSYAHENRLETDPVMSTGTAYNRPLEKIHRLVHLHKSLPTAMTG